LKVYIKIKPLAKFNNLKGSYPRRKHVIPI